MYRENMYWALVPASNANEEVRKIDINNLFLGPAGSNRKCIHLHTYFLYIAIPSKSTSLEYWSIFNSHKWSAFIEGIFFEQPNSIRSSTGESQLAESLVHEYLKYKEGCLKSLNGMFGGFIIDHLNNKLIAFTDRGGTKFIYAHRAGESWRVSNNLYALTQIYNPPHEMDLQSVFEYLSIGFALGNKTFIKDVILLSPGAMTSLNTKNIDTKYYYEFFERKERPIKECLMQITEALDCHFLNLKNKTEDSIGIGLSGGFDSRILLGMLKKHSINSIIVSAQPEFQLVKKMCQRLKENPIEVTDIPSVLSDQYKAWIMEEGRALAWSFVRMAAYIADKTPFFISGAFGDTLSGCYWKLMNEDHFKKKALSLQIKGDHLTQNLDIVLVSKLIGVDLKEKFYNLEKSWYADYNIVDNTLSDYDQILCHHLHNSFRKKMLPFISSRSLYTVPINPYLDNRVFSAYLKLPHSFLKKQYTHRLLIEMTNPILADFPRYGLPVKIKNINKLDFFIQLAYVMKNQWEKYKKHSYTHAFNRDILRDKFYAPIESIKLFDIAELKKTLDNSHSTIGHCNLENIVSISLFKLLYIEKRIPDIAEFKEALLSIGIEKYNKYEKYSIP